MKASSFTSARILVDTCQFSYIQGSVYLSVEGNGIDVYVKEVERITQALGEKEMQQAGPVEASGVQSEGDQSVETNRHFPVINDKDKPLMALNGRRMPRVLEGDETTFNPMTTCRNSTVGYAKDSNSKGRSYTKGLDDDRLTAEVLRDLGLAQSGPNTNSLVETNYDGQTKLMAKEVSGPLESGPSKPPGFENMGPIQSQDQDVEYSCVPNSIHDTIPEAIVLESE